MIDSSGKSWWIMEIRSNETTIKYAEQVKINRTEGDFIHIDRNTLASF